VDEEGKKSSESALEKIGSEDVFARLLEMELVELQPGVARATLKITEQIVNMHQMAHGGAIFTLADLACEAAGNSFGEPAIAIQTNIHFLNAAKRGDLLTADARLTSRFESFGMIEFEVKNHDGRLISTGQQTIIFRNKNS
jgi:acyl-CoA thioesterase